MRNRRAIGPYPDIKTAPIQINMEIIITHRNMDFDALACQVAASRLFPDAVRVYSGTLPPVIRNFLSLHMDRFELTPASRIDLQKVRKVIVVDVRNIERLQDYAQLWRRLKQGDRDLEVHIYDHHPNTDHDLIGHRVKVENTGAAVTLLVEEIIQKKISLTPVEATVIALGLYSDTGSLTYSSTTVRDVEAAVALIQSGANLGILRFFLHSPLDKAQLKVLSDILAEPYDLDLNGMHFRLAALKLKDRVSGLSNVVGEAMMLTGKEGFFALFGRNRTVTVIGRSWHPLMDVGRIMGQLGGGGHHGAGSATLKDTSLEKAKALLVEKLRADPPRPVTVSLIMTREVITLPHDMMLGQAARLLEEKGISGAPVFRDGEMKGILSKRDIRKAILDNRSHLPVSSCMSQNVKTAEPTLSLLRTFERMSVYNVGRLPVMDGDRLIGIITRNDILNVVYNGS